MFFFFFQQPTTTTNKLVSTLDIHILLDFSMMDFNSQVQTAWSHMIFREQSPFDWLSPSLSLFLYARYSKANHTQGEDFVNHYYDEEEESDEEYLIENGQEETETGVSVV